MRDVQIPWDLVDGMLTYREMGVYITLLAHANDEWVVTAPQLRMARRAGASVRTFGRILQELEQKAVIKRRHRWGEGPDRIEILRGVPVTD